MRNVKARTIIPPNPSLADDLVHLAQADPGTYRRRARAAASAVRITGADVVLAELRRQLDHLAERDPAGTAVALAAAVAALGGH